MHCWYCCMCVCVWLYVFMRLFCVCLQTTTKPITIGQHYVKIEKRWIFRARLFCLSTIFLAWRHHQCSWSVNTPFTISHQHTLHIVNDGDGIYYVSVDVNSCLGIFVFSRSLNSWDRIRNKSLQFVGCVFCQSVLVEARTPTVHTHCVDICYLEVKTKKKNCNRFE